MRKAKTMQTRDFPTADILSVTTGKLVSRRRMEGVCELIEWLTREAPFPRVLDQAEMRRLLNASAKARDLLIWQHPFLLVTEAPAGGNGTLFDWLLEIEAERGETLTLERDEVTETLARLSATLGGLGERLDDGRRALIELATALADENPPAADTGNDQSEGSR